jgi:hypothetical protein
MSSFWCVYSCVLRAAYLRRTPFSDSVIWCDVKAGVGARTEVGCRTEKRLLGDYGGEGLRAFITLIRYLLASLLRRWTL